MNKKIEYAFPSIDPYAKTQQGMTLRDYFAAKAMQGFVGNYGYATEDVAIRAYKMADLMLKEREKPND